MTNYQESYEKMSLASESFLNANSAVTASLPGFSNYFLIIQNTHKQIQETRVQQEVNKSGNVKTKNQLKDILILQAVDLARRMVAYATNVNDNGLLRLINYSQSDLKRSSDTKLISSCKVIRQNAHRHEEQLTAYGITSDIIKTLQKSINDFNEMIPKRRIDTADSGEATRLLSTLFKILSVNWNKIDTLVEIVRTSNQTFYFEYRKVRKIIEMGTHSLVLKMKVTNVQTKQPEANVTLILANQNSNLKSINNNGNGNGNGHIVKKTAKGGGVNFKNLPDGTYSVIANKPGFKEISESINVVNGELAVLELMLEKA